MTFVLGFGGSVNEAGVNYYKSLIKELKDNGIIPLVTIYHWDLPQTLLDQGAFLNEDIIEWFTNYARACYEAFGDDVKYWITFNEPKQVCSGGYGYGYMAPAIKSEGLDEYVCAHNLLKAHASAWHVYDHEFREKQQGILLDYRCYIVIESHFSSWHILLCNVFIIHYNAKGHLTLCGPNYFFIINYINIMKFGLNVGSKSQFYVKKIHK